MQEAKKEASGSPDGSDSDLNEYNKLCTELFKKDASIKNVFIDHELQGQSPDESDLQPLPTEKPDLGIGDYKINVGNKSIETGAAIEAGENVKGAIEDTGENKEGKADEDKSQITDEVTDQSGQPKTDDNNEKNKDKASDSSAAAARDVEDNKPDLLMTPILELPVEAIEPPPAFQDKVEETQDKDEIMVATETTAAVPEVKKKGKKAGAKNKKKKITAITKHSKK